MRSINEKMDAERRHRAIAQFQQYIQDHNIQDYNGVLSDYIKYLSAPPPWDGLPICRILSASADALALMVWMQDKDFLLHYLHSGLLATDKFLEFIASKSIGRSSRKSAEAAAFERWFVDRVFELKVKEKEKGKGASFSVLLRQACGRHTCCSIYVAKAYLKHGAVPTPCMIFDNRGSNALSNLFAPLVPWNEVYRAGLKDTTVVADFYRKYQYKGKNEGYDIACRIFQRKIRKSKTRYDELVAMTVSDMAALEQLYHTVLPTDVLLHCVAPFLALVGGDSRKR